jgi:hypothetical protein
MKEMSNGTQSGFSALNDAEEEAKKRKEMGERSGDLDCSDDKENVGNEEED